MAEQSLRLVLSYFKRHLRRSIMQAERDISIPYSTVQKIMRTLTHIFPYKITRVQHLRDNDKVNRVRFAEWCKLKMSRDVNFLSRIVFSDECVFHVSGIANTQNTLI